MNSIRSRLYDYFAKKYVKKNKNMFKAKSDLPEDFTVTYHTGAMNTKPNSVDSINTSISHGAQIVEFDVTFRPDGTPVIIHSNAPSNTQGVFLENALEAVAQSDTCMINLDIKSTANLSAVDKLVMMYGLTERVFYTGVFEHFVEAVKRDSEIPYYLNYNISREEASDIAALRNVAKKVRDYGAIGINSNYTHATELFVDTMRKNGLLVSLWTVNKPADMPKVLNLKPDNITTKKPHILKEFFK